MIETVSEFDQKRVPQRWSWANFARGDQLLIILSLLIGVIVGLTTARAVPNIVCGVQKTPRADAGSTGP
jgi:hypothetical protein